MNLHLADCLREISRKGVSGELVGKIIKILEGEGVTSESRFTEVLLDIVDSERRGEIELAPLEYSELFRIDEARDSNLKIVHQPPKGGFYWGGVEIEPKDISRFNGVRLHFLLLGDGSDTKLLAFKSYSEIVHVLRRQELLHMVRQEVSKQLGSVPDYNPPKPIDQVSDSVYSVDIQFQLPNPGPGDGREPETPQGGYVTCPMGPESPVSEAQFFQARNFSSSDHWFWLPPGRQIGRLTDWLLSHAAFSGGASWNDEISSVRSGDGLIVAFEAIDFFGSTFTIQGRKPEAVYSNYTHPICGSPIIAWRLQPPRQNIRALEDFGWGDRISSVQHFPGV